MNLSTFWSHPICYVRLYEMYLKSNRSDVTSNLFQFQTTNYIDFLSNPMSLIHFLILLCHASMYCWKDSYGVPLTFIITALLMVSMLSKWVSLNFRKRKVTRSKIRQIERLFYSGDILLSQELPDAQHTQSHYFLHMPKSLVVIF